ncbi:hypothetical protein [Shimia aestuarii]|uniref:hypothetical protein n=1 Tax=Shimia aestuarii TaxID=254406 RepID=UPI001FB3846D|nr:hypothetical protein [Shimia aestuarii]
MRPIAPLITTIALCACIGGDPFSQIGYFKDDNRNRVFMLYAENPTEEQAIEAARSSMHTSGRFTVTYIFVGRNKPKDIATLADNYVAANDAVYAAGKKWRWRYIASPNGKTILIDCYTKSPDPDHCN